MLLAPVQSASALQGVHSVNSLGIHMNCESEPLATSSQPKPDGQQLEHVVVQILAAPLAMHSPLSQSEAVMQVEPGAPGKGLAGNSQPPLASEVSPIAVSPASSLLSHSGQPASVLLVSKSLPASPTLSPGETLSWISWLPRSGLTPSAMPSVSAPSAVVLVSPVAFGTPLVVWPPHAPHSTVDRGPV